MQISVVELDFHHDSLDGILKIFQNTEHRIDVFTTSKNINLLKDISYSKNILFYEYTGGGKYFFLRKHRELLNSSSLIFINTVANDFGAYLAIDKNNVIVLRVHNVNKQFQPLKSIYVPQTWFFAWKSFSYMLRQILGKGFLWFRPLLNKRVSYFTFPDSSITDFVKQNHFINESKIIEPIPLKIFIENDTAFADYQGVLNVTIIGAIDHRRRQYEQTIEAFVLLFKSDNPPVIHLTVLGKCTSVYGSEVVGKLKSISHPNFRLTTFDKQVPETEFIECVKNTHLIISPITNNATTDIFKEVYGKTKTTGSILDFMKFGKVTLVPSYYSPPKEVAQYVIQYDGSEKLKNIILDLTNNNKINKLNRSALEFVKLNYSKEVVLKHTEVIFNNIAKIK